jgi:hypothetical protein
MTHVLNSPWAWLAAIPFWAWATWSLALTVKTIKGDRK